MIATLHQGAAKSVAAPLDLLDSMLERGDFDLVGVGRGQISDSDWAAKIETGRTDELRSFDAADLAMLT